MNTHANRVLAKLGLRTRVQTVVLAYETGLGAARPGLASHSSWGHREPEVALA